MFLQLSLYTRNVYLNIWTFLFDLPCYSCYGTTSTSTKNHHVNFPWKQVMKKHISAVLENIHIPQNSAENTPLEFPFTFLEVWIFSGTVFSCIKSMAKNDWFVIASKMTPSLGFWQEFRVSHCNRWDCQCEQIFFHWSQTFHTWLPGWHPFLNFHTWCQFWSNNISIIFIYKPFDMA